MAFLEKKNNAKSLVTDNPLAIAATTVNVTGGDGVKFPATGDFMLTIWDKVTYPSPGDDSNMEIVRATARSTDAITITRAQESTADVAHPQGSAIEMLITAGTLDETFDQNLKTSDSVGFSYDSKFYSSDSSVEIKEYTIGAVGTSGFESQVGFLTGTPESPLDSAIGISDYLVIADIGGNNEVSILLAKQDLSNSMGFTADFTNSLLLVDQTIAPEDTNTSDMGTSSLFWKDSYIAGKSYFRDTSLYVTSDTDGDLDLWADTGINFNTAATENLSYASAASGLLGDNYPTLTPTSGSTMGSLLNIKGAVIIEAARDEDTMFDMGGTYFDAGLVDYTEHEHNIASAQSSLLVGQFMNSNRTGTVDAYLDGYTELDIAHYFNSNNDATYSGSYGLTVVTAGIQGSCASESTFDATGKTFSAVNIGFAANIDSVETLTAGTLTVENTGFTAQIETVDSDVDSSTVNKLYSFGNINTSSTHNASIHDSQGYGWYNVIDNAPLRFGAGNTSSGIENDGDVEIVYTGADWDFNVRIATTAIRFNQSMIDTDFMVYGNTGVMLTLDAGDLSSTFSFSNSSLKISSYDFTLGVSTIEAAMITGTTSSSSSVVSVANNLYVVDVADDNSASLIFTKEDISTLATLNVNFVLDIFTVSMDWCPSTSDTFDLGTTTYKWEDLFLNGKAYFRDSTLGIYSQANTFLDLFADGAVRIGNSSTGAPTTYIRIDPDADTYWVGDGSGIPYGHMYSNTTQAITITDTTPVEVTDGYTTGEVNLVTYGASHYLAVDKAGRYKIDWSMSLAQNSPSAAIQCNQGIMIDGVAQVRGRAKNSMSNSTDIYNSSGTAILDLDANKQISLYVANLTNATNIDVENANVTVTMVGGT